MAINDAATLVVGAGNYFIADPGTELPSDLSDPTEGGTLAWEVIGHTSLEDIMSITSEGGEPTVIGTLQNKQLRTKYSPRTESFGIILQQWDEPALRLYFGQNMEELADGTLGVPVEPVPTRKAFMAIFTDGDTRFAFYAPLAEIYRSEDVEISDTESLAGLPLSIKPLPYESNKWAYAVTPLGA